MVGAYEIIHAAQNMLKLTHISICFMYCVEILFSSRSNARAQTQSKKIFPSLVALLGRETPERPIYYQPNLLRRCRTSLACVVNLNQTKQIASMLLPYKAIKAFQITSRPGRQLRPHLFSDPSETNLQCICIFRSRAQLVPEQDPQRQLAVSKSRRRTRNPAISELILSGIGAK